MSSKDYIFVRTTFINNKYHFNIEKRFTIKCIGGETLPKEQPKMVFVDCSEIPSKVTRKGLDWKAIFVQIPINKAWIVPEKDYKMATVKSALKRLLENKQLGENEYEVTQRTGIDGKAVVYVCNNGKPEKPKK